MAVLCAWFRHWRVRVAPRLVSQRKLHQHSGLICVRVSGRVYTLSWWPDVCGWVLKLLYQTSRVCVCECVCVDITSTCSCALLPRHQRVFDQPRHLWSWVVSESGRLLQVHLSCWIFPAEWQVWRSVTPPSSQHHYYQCSQSCGLTSVIRVFVLRYWRMLSESRDLHLWQVCEHGRQLQVRMSQGIPAVLVRNKMFGWVIYPRIPQVENGHLHFCFMFLL